MRNRRSLGEVAEETSAKLVVSGILLGGGLLGIYAAVVYTKYTPLASAHQVLTALAVVVPLAVAPFAYLFCTRNDRQGLGLLIAAALGLGGAGYIRHLHQNGANDAAPPKLNYAPVLSHHTGSAKGMTTYQVTVGPWPGGPAGNRKFPVGNVLHSRINPGDQILIVTKPGAHGIEWVIGARGTFEDPNSADFLR